MGHHHMITRSKKQMITRSKKTKCKPVIHTPTKRKERKKLCFHTRNPELPIELVIEILSWLSVDCLTRFKSVCRQWCELIQDRYFVEKHLSRSNLFSYYQDGYKENGEAIDWISKLDGLVVELNKISNKVRIRNLAIKKIYDFPDPEHQIYDMLIGFSRRCGYYKAVSLHSCKGKNHESGFEILTIGSEEEPSWRTLDSAFFRDFDSQKEKLWSIRVDETAYFVRTSKGGLEDYEIVSFDLNTECFTSSILPRSSLSDSNYSVFIIPWENKYLSIAELAKGDELRVLVFQDCKKGKWAEEKIVFPIPLKIFKKAPGFEIQNVEILQGFRNFFTFRVGGKKCYMYDIRRERIYSLATRQDNLIKIKQGLVAFKGMRPE
ncbi:hypothetical protein RCOM_0545330 [Ricinus communis]|uniref:F-box domain-containing protein n=1 Tax=Ricinus communis TaxID=3988 RepID=B9STW7_RICCO|nr:hypothetical protein RCOM_0545330 [Ricinus communis]